MKSDDTTDSLGDLQRWFQAVVTTPFTRSITVKTVQESVSNAIASGSYPVRSTGGLNAAQRIDIYRRGYWLRLLDAMRGQFPLLRRWLGDALFDEFAIEYLRHHPPASYTLAQLGDNFPSFLSRSALDSQATGEEWARVLIELARLERAMAYVDDDLGPEDMKLASSAHVQQLDERAFLAWHPLTIPGVRLLTCNFPIHEFARALANGKEVRLPLGRSCVVGLFRRRYRVEFIEMAVAQADALAGLNGQTSISRLLSMNQANSSYCAQLSVFTLRCWLSHWADCGLLVKQTA